MELLIWLGVTGLATGFGYLKSRQFVRGRLRFVDAVQRPVAPLVVGGAAALLAAPVVAVLPVVGAGTALLLGTGVGLGVRHGARDARTLPG